MECLGQVFSIVPCLWECSAKRAAYIRDLEENLSALRTAMGELDDISQDVKNRVKEDEDRRMKRTNQVSGWLQRVGVMEKEVNQILQKGTQELENKCLGSCCPKNCRSSYKLGKEVLKMIPKVAALSEKGKFDVVADQLPPPAVDEQPMENAVVGFESKFQEVWRYVENRDYPVIGLVGIGGVGKTTLLKQLNNEFLNATHGYDWVIWVVVSQPASLGRIQDTIRNKLNIADHLWANKSEGERAVLIYKILKEKKFVMLLDDMWETLELSKIGIPQPSRDSMSKVVLTTRSRDVCRSMDADKSVEVGCLPPDEAFTLFCSKVGEDVLKSHSEIHDLVKDVASECQGLPLALVTIGRAMRGKTDAQQWKDAKMALEKYPSRFADMEKRVFARLLFSYDSLPTPTLQKCFEYCSLYPEDHNIKEEEIIKLWLAEGLIDEYDNMSHALLQGRQIIESLVQASLLEIGEEEGMVKMHDVLRDMALWVASEHGKKKNKFWVINVASGDYDSISAAPNVMRNWRTSVQKISIWGDNTTNVGSLAELSSCSNLVTLIIQNTKLKELSGEVFRSLNVLKVLDLSYNGALMGLPIEIGGLSDLEYLNIGGTEVRMLPLWVKQLSKLRFLMIEGDTIIPKDVLSNLLLLEIFEQASTQMRSKPKSMEMEMLNELEGLKHIMDLRLVLTSAAGIQLLLKSPKLQSCTCRLELFTNESLPDELDFGEGTLTKHLETLTVCQCGQLRVMNLGRSSLWNNLYRIVVFDCNKIRNLSSLISAPNLSTLFVFGCESMEELIGEETMTSVSTSLFSHLTELSLLGLPKLRSICPQSALPFPSLKAMEVYDCKSLRKLPLDLNTVTTAPPDMKIYVQTEWWDKLQWDSQATKDAFTPKFVASQF